MTEREARSQLPSTWLLVVVLALGVIAWLATAVSLGVGCENREDETVCEVGSVTSATLLFTVLEALVVAGWRAARVRRSPPFFTVASACAVAVNLGVACGALLWASGDL